MRLVDRLVYSVQVNWSNGRGELLCRTGGGKVRRLLEIGIELIWNDITV